MRNSVIELALTVCLVIILPILGAIWMGKQVDEYFLFLPRTQLVRYTNFSIYFFLMLAISVIGVVLPFIWRVFKTSRSFRLLENNGQKGKFPWWGWIGLIVLVIAWVLAWTRFPWFINFQKFAFVILWLPFIVVVNAVTFKQTGHCLMLDLPSRFIMLFPISASFWWLFEYLNRFVHNWYYVGLEQMSSYEYFVFATICFSTVLPAVASIYEYLSSKPSLTLGLEKFVSAPIMQSRTFFVVVFIVSIIVLVALPVLPNYLFPALWLCPLALLISIQTLRGKQHVLSDVARGNWTLVCQFALVGLICGFFWEMWNYGCLVKWKYSIPFVDRFHIFEMPVLGYAGYLPFGLECAVVIDIVMKGQLSRTGSLKM